MNSWTIASWIFVALLTAGNIFFFLKMKQVADQMAKMAFPGSKGMADIMLKMQQGQKNQKGRPGAAAGFKPGIPTAGAGAGNMDAQLKAAMNMLQQMQKGKKR